MHWTRIVGIALLIVGIALLLMGWNAADSLTEDIHEGLTGRFTDTTTLYLIGGGVAAVVGVLMTAFGARGS